jgi:hypothetical protein
MGSPRKTSCLRACERRTQFPRAPSPSQSAAKPGFEKPILDPRAGDADYDASSPKQKSLLAIAGSLLAEISLPKLLLAWAGVWR